MKIWELTMYLTVGGQTFEGIVHARPPQTGRDLEDLLGSVVADLREQLLCVEGHRLSGLSFYWESEEVEVIEGDHRLRDCWLTYSAGLTRTKTAWQYLGTRHPGRGKVNGN